MTKEELISEIRKIIDTLSEDSLKDVLAFVKKEHKEQMDAHANRIRTDNNELFKRLAE